MKSKMLSFIVTVVMITSIFGIIPHNAGQFSLSLGRSNEFKISNPQNEGEPNSSGTMDLTLTNISAPIPKIVMQSSSISSGTGGLANSPWPMFRQNLNHTGLSPYNTSTNNGQLKWSFTTNGIVFSSPAISSDGIIYIGSHDNKLYAINPDGTEKWSFTTRHYVSSSPAIGSDGTIYVGSHDSNLYAINPDGTQKWNFVTGSSIKSSPIIGSDGIIYIGSDDTKFYAINPDGTEKWNYQIVGNVQSSPAIGSDDTIYVGSWGHILYALNPNGTEKWNFTTGFHIISSPAISNDGTIYVGSYDKKLYAINPDGTEKWNFTTGSQIQSSPAIGPDGTIYIGSYDNKLYAINPDGTEKWSYITSNYIYSSPAIGSDGSIYFGGQDNKLYSINVEGSEKWSYLTGDIILSSPAIDSNGTIYIGSRDNKLYAIGGIPPNQIPIAYAGPDHTINEGDSVQLNGSASHDPDGTIETYEWDLDTSDGLWWETGGNPEAIGPITSYTYGDNGNFTVTLRVTDDQNLTDTDICNVTVLNVDPTVIIESATMDVEIGLRVAGRKYNDVNMTLYEEGGAIGYISIERMPGSPNDQMAWIPVTLDMTKSYSVIVTYTPEDPPKIGGNPVWIYVKFEDESEEKIHHTFNVQQSKKRDSNHWNHVEPWEVDLMALLVGHPFEVISHITDPGSDDETLTYGYGSQSVTVEYLNDPPNPDPFPSPEVNPVDVFDTTSINYEGPDTLTLTVIDDDGGTLIAVIDLN